MSDTTSLPADAPRPVPPTLLPTSSNESISASPKLTRRRSKTESSAKKASGVQWVDVDRTTTPKRRRKRTSQSSASSPSNGHSRSRSSTESELGRFLPKLARILESAESSVVGSSSRNGRRYNTDNRERSVLSDAPLRQNNRSSGEGGIIQRRSPVKHKVGSRHRRADTLPRYNPSLLSVFSSLTRASDHSSSSGTTITQESYHQKDLRHFEGSTQDRSRRKSDTETGLPKRDQQPNVFDFMDPPNSEAAYDARSVYSSSSSSSYEPSDASSSEAPGSPSSQSTYGSPTATRNGSLSGSIGVAELRRKYDSQYAASGSVGSSSPEVANRSLKRSSLVNDIPENEESGLPTDPPPPFHEVEHDSGQRSGSRSSQAWQAESDRLKQQQDAARHHVAQQSHQYVQPQGHLRVDSACGQRRSSSSSSAGSSESQRAWQQYMAMQQYQHQHAQYQRSPPVASLDHPTAQHTPNGHIVANVERPPPPVPDAPDLTQKTIVGYELLARELSNSKSEGGPKPIYKNFTYLTHRLLLHIQDELQEMEETLRIYDEIIAQQQQSSSPTEQSPPASRRADYKTGSEVHYRRTMLLGNIYKKMEQYRQIKKELGQMRQAGEEEVKVYRRWMKEKNAVCEVERGFLDEGGDLVVPCAHRAGKQEDKGKEQGCKICIEPGMLLAMMILPAGMMALIALLLSVVTSTSGRLVLTTIMLGIGSVLLLLLRSHTGIPALLCGKQSTEKFDG